MTANTTPKTVLAPKRTAKKTPAKKKAPAKPAAKPAAKKAGGARPGAGRPSSLKRLMTAAALLTSKANKPLPPPKKRSAKGASVEAAGRIANGDIRCDVPGSRQLDPMATPLDVMVQAMRDAYAIGGAIMAAPFAEKAAPYVHGKIAPQELKPARAMTDKEGEEAKVRNYGLREFLLEVEYVDAEDIEFKESKVIPNGDATEEGDEEE